MIISEVTEILKATILVGEDQQDNIITGAGAADLMDDVLAAAAKGCALLTGVTTIEVIQKQKLYK